MSYLFHYVFSSDGYSSSLKMSTHFHRSCTWKVFPLCEFSCDLSMSWLRCMSSYIGCICWASPHYESAYVFWQWLHAWMYSYTGSICGHPPWSQTRFVNFPFPCQYLNEYLSLILCPFTPCLWMRQREMPWKRGVRESESILFPNQPFPQKKLVQKFNQLVHIPSL